MYPSIIIVYEIGIVKTIEKHKIRMEYPIEIYGCNFAHDINISNNDRTNFKSTIHTITIHDNIVKKIIWGNILQHVLPDD